MPRTPLAAKFPFLGRSAAGSSGGSGAGMFSNVDVDELHAAKLMAGLGLMERFGVTMLKIRQQSIDKNEMMDRLQRSGGCARSLARKGEDY